MTERQPENERLGLCASLFRYLQESGFIDEAERAANWPDERAVDRMAKYLCDQISIETGTISISGPSEARTIVLGMLRAGAGGPHR